MKINNKIIILIAVITISLAQKVVAKNHAVEHIEKASALATTEQAAVIHNVLHLQHCHTEEGRKNQLKILQKSMNEGAVESILSWQNAKIVAGTVIGTSVCGLGLVGCLIYEGYLTVR
ncbi:hypothetical protein HYX58_03725 [Candidatus Dependentiae bacterium]|nr:hypothetical protein [Candidatus Dependentiae bacterium]